MNSWPIKLSLFINYFVFAMLLNSVGTVILQVQNTYDVSESSASVLEAFKDLSIALTSFLVASFIARIGYKRAMLTALALLAAVCLAMPHVPTFWMTELLFAATGFGFALVKVSVFASFGLVTASKKEHVSLMNLLESFFMVGVLSGYFIFSVFVDDREPKSFGWLRVYYLLAGLCLVAFALLLSTRMDESAIKSDKPGSVAHDFGDMLRLCFKTKVLIFVISTFLYVLIEQSIMTWLPTFNRQILNLSASLSIQMTSILAASAAFGRLGAAIVLRRVDWFWMLVVSLTLAAAVVLVALPLAGTASTVPGVPISGWFDAPIAAFMFPLIGVCLAPVYPAINSLMLSSLPERRHAPMSGLIVVFSALGGTLGSLITGAMFESFGGKTAFSFSLVPITLMVFALYSFKRQPDPIFANEESDAVPSRGS